MKAYLLAAGVGYRLRPLTQWLPKPLVPFLNHPLVYRQHQNLLKQVEHVRFNISHLASHLADYVEQSPNSSYMLEPAPLGSGRTVWADRAYFDQTTLVACADILADYDLPHLYNLHKQSGALVTIATVQVEDPRSFGVIVSDANGKIEGFQEKPDAPLSDCISTGIYIFEPEVLKYWQPEWVDLGGDVFPALVAAGLPVYAHSLGCAWHDVGRLDDYILLQLRAIGSRNLIDPTASVAPSAVLQRVVVGAGAVVGDGARLTNCVIWPGAMVEPESVMTMSVITPERVVPLERRQRQQPVAVERRQSWEP